MKETINYIGWWSSGNKKTYIEEITEDRGNEFKGIIVKYGYVTKFGVPGDQRKGWFRVKNQRNIYPKSGITWENGYIKLNIETTVGESMLRKIVKEEVLKIIKR